MEQRANHHSEYPRTVTEAVDWLESIIPAGELELIAAMDVDDVVGLHVELGAYIRERLGLWSGNDALMSGHGGVRVSRDIEVEEHDEGWVVHAKFGTLQPGQRNWLEGRFFISAPLDVTLKCNCRVFADDASPVGSELRIDVQCQERHITQDDLSRSDQDG